MAISVEAATAVQSPHKVAPERLLQRLIVGKLVSELAVEGAAQDAKGKAAFNELARYDNSSPTAKQMEKAKLDESF